MFFLKNSSLSFFLILSFLGCSESEKELIQEPNYESNVSNDSVKLPKMGESNDFSEYIKEANDPFAKDENVSEDLNLPLPMNLKSNGPRNGLIKEYYEDGSVKEEVFFVNGVKEGNRKIWYANGQISKSGVMKDDRWHGQYEEWYSTGEPKVSGHYFEGKQDGEWKFFDKEGNALPDLFFKNGVETTRKLPKLLGN